MLGSGSEAMSTDRLTCAVGQAHTSSSHKPMSSGAPPARSALPLATVEETNLPVRARTSHGPERSKTKPSSVQRHNGPLDATFDAPSFPRRSKSPVRDRSRTVEQDPDSRNEERGPAVEETEEEYDARLEREEKERIALAKQQELDEIKRRYAESAQSNNGIRFKGVLSS